MGRARKQASILFCAAFLAVQVAVPAWQLSQPRPARFGWQMYSGIKPQPRMFTITEDGGQREVDLRRHVGYQRIDLDYVAFLPPHLCQTIPGVQAVRVQIGEKSETRECR